MPKVLNVRHLQELPPGAVYIGRAVPRHPKAWVHVGSKWANEFKIGRDGTRDEVIAKYRTWICDQPDLLAALDELEGHDLVCWCAPKPCHGDVLLELLASRSQDT
jgi:hypothetical protein